MARYYIKFQMPTFVTKPLLTSAAICGSQVVTNVVNTSANTPAVELTRAQSRDTSADTLQRSVTLFGNLPFASPKNGYGIYRHLSHQLGAIWETMRHPHERLLELEDYTRGKKLQMARQMARVIVRARARELGIKPNEVVVVVAGFGPNTYEAFLWHDVGAKVIAVEYKETFRKMLELVADDKYPNLQIIDPIKERTPRGDVTTWIYPIGCSFGENVDLVQYSKEDGIVLVQSEQIDRYITPYLSHEIIFNEYVCEEGHYFLPSIFVPCQSKLLIFKRAKNPV